MALPALRIQHGRNHFAMKHAIAKGVAVAYNGNSPTVSHCGAN